MTGRDKLWTRFEQKSTRWDIHRDIANLQDPTAIILQELKDRLDTYPQDIDSTRNGYAVVWFQARKIPGTSQLIADIEAIAEGW